MAIIENEHFVDYFESLNTIVFVKTFYLCDHGIWRAHPVTVYVEGRVDATKRTFIGTAERCVDRSIGSSCLQIVEALPIVSTIVVHGEEVPHVAVQILIKIREQWCGWVYDNVITVVPH